MKKRFLSSMLAMSLILSIIIAGSAIALARNQEQPVSPLAQQVLQRDDLPNSQGYYAEEVTEDRFPGPSSPVNTPLQAEGFLEGYEASAWHPYTLQEEVNEELVKDGQSGAFVLNVAYKYQNKSQAEAAFEQQIAFFDQKLPTDFKVESVDYDRSLATANGMYGHATRLTYPSEGITWATYWFLGIKDNTLMLLMVDGLPDPATQEVFDSLVTIVVQR